MVGTQAQFLQMREVSVENYMCWGWMQTETGLRFVQVISECLYLNRTQYLEFYKHRIYVIACTDFSRYLQR